MTKRAKIFLSLWFLIAGSLGSPSPCAADSPVTLRSDIEVRRPAVRLSDVFAGVPGDIDRDIAQAPPCKQMIYDINVLNRLADKYRLDWQPQGYADHATVTTACIRITADTIRDAVIQKAREESLPDVHKDSLIDVAFDNRSLEVDLPADQGADFTLNNFDYDSVNKHFRADLVAATSTGPLAVPVGGRLVIKRNVPVLIHRLAGGTTISAADIDWAAIPVDRINGTIVTDAKQVIGRELRRDTGEGELLHTNDVIPPRYVTRGSVVTLKIETPFMQLTAQGRALQDGTQGDTVRVVNTQSNRMVEGVVGSPGVVLISTAGQKVAAAQ